MKKYLQNITLSATALMFIHLLAIRSAWNDANVGKCGRFFNNIAVKGIVLSSNLMIGRHPHNTKQYNS